MAGREPSEGCPGVGLGARDLPSVSRGRHGEHIAPRRCHVRSAHSLLITLIGEEVIKVGGLIDTGI